MLGDRYRIEALIGTGGYGRVYRATQLPIEIEVAIKVVDPLDREAVARFRREIGFVKQLVHPNTVRILDSGTSDAGLPFVVMEYLRGLSVFDLLTAEGHLAPKVALQITAQVLKALAEAHAIGIVHRDIKPENVFVTSHAGQPVFVKVLDFGIAKQQRRTESVLTVRGEAPGTPSYMAPEQVRGMEADARTDLYAVGLMLAEMLTGRTVFDQGGAETIMRAQISQAPAPLDPRLQGLPGAEIASKASQKAPRDRYASATEMLAAIETTLIALTSKPPEPRRARLERDQTTRAMPIPVVGMTTPMLTTSATLPFQAPARRTVRSRWIITFAIVAIALGLGAAVLAGVLLFGRSEAPHQDTRRRTRTSRIDDAPRTSTPPPDPPLPLDHPRIKAARTTDIQEARRLLTEQGYTIEKATDSSDQTLRAIKGTCIGELLFTTITDQKAANYFMTHQIENVGGDVYAVRDAKGMVMIFMRHTMGSRATERCTRPVVEILGVL